MIERHASRALGALALLLLGASPAANRQDAPPASAPLSCKTIYNITKFGAVGDDRTDNERFIQAAIDAAQRASYGCIYVPSGNFRTNGTERIARAVKGFAIEGDGAASRVLASNDADVFLLPEGGNGFSVRDLYIGYAGKLPASLGAAIHTLNGTANFQYERLTIEKTGYGLRIEQTANQKGGGGTNVLDETRIHGMRVGVYSNSSMTVTDSHIWGGTYGYVADGQAGGTRMVAVPLFGTLSLLLENTIGRTGGVNSFYGWDVEANYERPGAAPFPPEGVGSIDVVANNTEFHCDECWLQDGTLIGSAQATPKHVTLSGGNYASYPLAHYAGATKQVTANALEIAFAARATVSGGDYTSRIADAIHVDSSAGPCIVTGNHILGKPVYGIFVGPSDEQVVEMNTIDGWRSAPIKTAGPMSSNSKIVDNVQGTGAQ